MPSSSFSSRISAASGVSPGCSLPPGNSHSPAIVLPSGRRASSTRPSHVDQRAGGDQQQRLVARPRSGRRPGGRRYHRAWPRNATGASPPRASEVLRALAALAEADTAQHRGGGGVVGRDVGFACDRGEIGEAPARQPAGGFGGDAEPPEAAADPVAQRRRARLGVHAQPDHPEQHLLVAVAAGDGERVAGTVGQFARGRRRSSRRRARADRGTARWRGCASPPSRRSAGALAPRRAAAGDAGSSAR